MSVPEITTDFARAWVEFPDPAQEDQIIRADLTWLTSRWHCIYGKGCKGIDASIPYGGCCTLGAHFADADDQNRVAKSVAELTDADWQLRPSASVKRSDWVEADADGEPKTRTAEGACIFLNGPDFPGGAGCALHVLAERTGRSHVETKPDVCWQLPIRRDYEERERADGVETDVVVITEYVRGMWGAGGHDLDWYCSSNTEAHTAAEPVYLNSRTELVALLGEPAYLELVRYCERHVAASDALHVLEINPEPLAPHPADTVPSDLDETVGSGT